MTVLADYLDAGDLHPDDTASFFGSIGKAIGGAAKGVAKGVSSAAKFAGKGIKAVGPVWDIAQTGASFIPGVGTAVSAGMASAAALGRGKSLQDAVLAGARGALPGGAVAKAAFDVAVGAAKGHRLDGVALRALRNQVPGGAAGRAAFDAGLALASKAKGGQIERARSRLSREERKTFDAAVRGAKVKPKPRKLPRLRRRNQVRRIALPIRQATPNRFASLTPSGNKVAAGVLANPAMRAKNAAGLAKAFAVERREARDAIGAIARRYGVDLRDFRDVGDLETLDGLAQRNGVTLPADLQTSAASEPLELIVVPPVAVNPSFVQALFSRGDANIKRALQAHELLATLARETGELEGPAGWRIRSGDYPYKVAQTVTGDPNRWREIPSVNAGMKIYTDSQGRTQLSGWTVGKLINLPPSWFPSQLEPATPTASSSTDAEAEPVSGSERFPAPSEYPNGYPSAIYVVRDGDTGEKIAERITGEKRRWTELVKANPKLADATYGLRIYAGQKIALPESWVAVAPAPEAISAEVEAEAEPVDVVDETPAPTPVAVEPSPIVEAEPVEPQPVIAAGPIVEASPVEDTTPTAPEPAPVGMPAPAWTRVTGTAQQIAMVQVMLGYFLKAHPEASWSVQWHTLEGGTGGPVFGELPDDYAGRWTQRTSDALTAFDKWHNKTVGVPTLDEDGLPDPVSISTLRAQAERDAGVQPGTFTTTPSPIVMPSPSPAPSGPIVAGNARPPVPTPQSGSTGRAAAATTPKKGGDAGPLVLAALAALPFVL